MKTKKLILLVATAFLTGTTMLQAQEQFEPTVSWPYELPEFTFGEIRTFQGATIKSADLNVCINDGKLHFINEGIIQAAEMTQVGSAKIGDKIFLNKGGRLYQVLSRDEKSMVVQGIFPDVDAAEKVNIGYGIASSTASHDNISTLSSGSNMINMNLMSARERRGEGVVIPIKTKLFIVVNGLLIEAGKRQVLEAAGPDKEQISAFIKTNKTKWKKVESLAQLATFMANINNNN